MMLRAIITSKAIDYFMFEIPDPLHPAVVHFPIVLVFLGTVFSFLAVFTRRAGLPQLTAVILILGAGAAQFAIATGSDQVDPVLQRTPEAKPLIYRHAEMGLWTRNIAVAAACSAVVALAFYKVRTFRRVMAFVTTVLAAGACFFALQAAERGAEMVYHHGVGIQIKPASPGTSPGG